MTKKHVYRQGDKVRIVRPFRFIRCGYPKTVTSETEHVLREFGPQIAKLSQDCGVHPEFEHRGKNPLRKIAAEIAYLRLKTYGYGGRERQIYREVLPQLEGKEFFVIDKKTCVTGTYNSSSGYVEDYEPATLSNQKTHLLLQVSRYRFPILKSTSSTSSFWIEACNIELVN